VRFLAPKRYADDSVSDALAAGIGQVVILGAGLDTKACRLVAPAGALAVELDQRANTDYELRRLRAIYGRPPERIRVSPVDFEVGDLAEESVRRTLAFLAEAPAGSRLIFTYVRADFLDGTNVYGAGRLRERMTGRHDVWKFGLAPPDVATLLREYGWVEREQIGPAEYVARYLRPAGRDMPVSEIERFVRAEKV
jgi:O-methyltransferase involved in polyketide biosynthesis